MKCSQTFRRFWTQKIIDFEGFGTLGRQHKGIQFGRRMYAVFSAAGRGFHAFCMKTRIGIDLQQLGEKAVGHASPADFDIIEFFPIIAVGDGIFILDFVGGCAVFNLVDFLTAALLVAGYAVPRRQVAGGNY